jgi:hypothetical protein
MSDDTHSERRVPHAGTYRRELPVSIERIYENAIDWEHLPYLHHNSFSAPQVIDADSPVVIGFVEANAFVRR